MTKASKQLSFQTRQTGTSVLMDENTATKIEFTKKSERAKTASTQTKLGRSPLLNTSSGEPKINVTALDAVKTARAATKTLMKTVLTFIEIPWRRRFSEASAVSTMAMI